MKFKLTLFLLGTSLYLSIAKAQVPDYKTRIHYLYTGINKHLKDQKTGLYYETTEFTKNENPHSWLLPLCALI